MSTFHRTAALFCPENTAGCVAGVAGTVFARPFDFMVRVRTVLSCQSQLGCSQ